MEEYGITLGEICRIIFRRVWWVIGVTAAFLLITVLLVQFWYNPNNRQYTVSYNIRFPDSSSGLYPDGTPLRVTDSVLLAKLAGIGHRRVFEVVFISHVQLLGPRILLAGLEFTVVLFNAFQHSLDASGLCMQPGKPTKESDSQEYLFHCSVFDWVVKHCLRFIILYTMGMMNPLRNVDVSSPPRITLAIGL